MVLTGMLHGVGSAPAWSAEFDRPAEHLAAFDEKIQPFLENYCFRCHRGERARADLHLDEYADIESVARDHARWARVLERLGMREMPPKKKKQPSDVERAEVVAWVRAELEHVDCDGPRNPGRVTMRRLNRAEYENTIRDLFGVALDVAGDFPVDDSGYGFDNVGDVLSISPLLMERYLAAAERVAQAVIVAPEPPAPDVKRLGAGSLARSGGTRANDDGACAFYSAGEIHKQVRFPADGQYTLRARAFGQQAGPNPARMAFRLEGKDVAVVDVEANENDPQVYEVKLDVKAGEHRVALAFVNDYYQPKHENPDMQGDRNLIVEYVELEAPLDAKPRPVTDAHRRLMTCQPTDEASRRDCARRIIGETARRAFRRPVKPEERDRFVGLVELVVAEGESFERGVQLALQAILVSPHFLFLVESEPPGVGSDTVYDLGDFELASRLSYFLWSSVPDEALFALAGRGVLHEDDVLEAQVTRMLADPKSKSLVENFAGQWLELRKLDEIAPDPKRFPGFDDALRTAMRGESEQFFAAVMKENRSIFDFVLADHTYVNERLARHYGLAKVKGPAFRRVALTGDRAGGVLTQASVLTVTSDPTRTSPVKRGKWVLEQILGTPPPPPPPNVDPLPEGDQAELTGTMRERMEQHRTRPDCKSCHRMMDPIGFGMENFDAVGAWRDKDGAFAIDASGTLPDGASFNGPTELQRILMSKEDLFRRCLTEKMLVYGLGRGLEYYDRCTVDAICQAMAARGDTFSTLIVEIVKSDPFRRRMSRGDDG